MQEITYKVSIMWKKNISTNLKEDGDFLCRGRTQVRYKVYDLLALANIQNRGTSNSSHKFQSCDGFQFLHI